MLLLFCEDAPTLPVTNDTLRGIGSRQEVQRERGFHTGREGGCEDEKNPQSTKARASLRDMRIWQQGREALALLSLLTAFDAEPQHLLLGTRCMIALFHTVRLTRGKVMNFCKDRKAFATQKCGDRSKVCSFL